MKNLAVLLVLLVLFVQNAFMQQSAECKNLVPNEVTAIKIAEAIWLPIYGKAIYRKKPFTAKLVDDSVWQVSGTLKTRKGGVPYIEVQKCDGQILNVSHGK